MASPFLLPAVLALAFAQALAYDPTPLQDFCVADLKSNIFINGYPCKNPKTVTVEDFSFSGLNIPGNTKNKFGFNVTIANVMTLPGLNTLGVSIARIDYAPHGVVPPHTHPRGTEFLTVIEGTLIAGFVTSNPNNTLYQQILHPGDVTVFPIGMIHFQLNIGKGPAVAIVGLNSQNPGFIFIGDAVFGSKPPIPVQVLEKSFQVGPNVIQELLAQFK
ncbi:germin-like protein subfamily 1 member 16 [Ananas comosus]|uniref:Germin-like protein n=1 Tax=Ananas comosus TaxID=4615 RepID=A0A6P5GQ16_ANACO|nr:germin-like protein subfamily 1 member 16 [Ananas comosus]